MISKDQLKELIDKTLKEYSLYSLEAAELVYGTIIQESKRGTYLKQRAKSFNIDKHAIGIGQMEKNTFDWLKRVFLGKYPWLINVNFHELEYNLKYAILFTRFRYLVDKEPIPKTLEGQAKYWKRIYNTEKGKGTVQQYMDNYIRYS